MKNEFIDAVVQSKDLELCVEHKEKIGSDLHSKIIQRIKQWR